MKRRTHIFLGDTADFVSALTSAPGRSTPALRKQPAQKDKTTAAERTILATLKLLGGSGSIRTIVDGTKRAYCLSYEDHFAEELLRKLRAKGMVSGPEMGSWALVEL